MKLPRVLMLPKWYPHRYDDQDGDFVARHVAAIAPHAQVAVLFAAVARGPLPGLTDCEADLNGEIPTLRYYYRAQPTGLAPLDKVLKLLLYFWCLGRGYRRLTTHWGGSPQLTHVHVLLRTGLFAWWLKLTQGIPYLITEHWTLYLPQNAGRMGKLRRWLSQRIVGQAAALHTVSRNLGQAMQQLGLVNARAVVLPNVVDTQLFKPAAGNNTARDRAGAGPLLHVAAFNEQAKNLSGILRVVARLSERWPGLTLRIAGYGPAEAELRQLAADLGLLDTHVFFLGKLSPAQVAEQMRQAVCLVLFSNYENLPCVLIEAQASGLPAVATAVGGVPELLPPDGSRGLLVPPRDEAALEQALSTVLRHPERFEARQLRQHAVAHFSYGEVGRQFVQLYAQLLMPTAGGSPTPPLRP
ncbi:glycosyltransferase [Hymenobacter chitinivorans]|uniref:Glycosyltransferase involved in cell wall biosynthesis n=1 Tax=Hymenobacter chitinivorans DSM 11115 TaxID=1121954 RepID=A0A2M9B966_9BACT|nr:glycosyltransferase [Hymenobacter chitinivorans]PJJ54496.1 glycosyltransferase involved in cell wall biosynthesis [Hymenobacter chitinivorans DSM 11115]